MFERPWLSTRITVRTWFLVHAIPLALVGLSCSTAPPPVPMIGSIPAVSSLEGDWSGEYSSAETGRHGSITFRLEARSDSAIGDVIMLPRRVHHAADTPGISPETDTWGPRSIRIAFVFVADDSVSGELDPYEDPTCGCVLTTRFTGRLADRAIEGIYTSVNTETKEVTRGDWIVRRRS